MKYLFETPHSPRIFDLNAMKIRVFFSGSNVTAVNVTSVNVISAFRRDQRPATQFYCNFKTLNMSSHQWNYRNDGPVTVVCCYGKDGNGYD